MRDPVDRAVRAVSEWNAFVFGYLPFVAYTTWLPHVAPAAPATPTRVI